MSGGWRIPKHLQGDPATLDMQRKLNDAMRQNPLISYNNPHLNPSKIHKIQLQFNAIKPPVLGTKAAIAGNRSGKTVCCTVDDTVQLIPKDEVPPHLAHIKKFEAPCHIWVGAPKYSKHEDTIVPLFRKWLPKAQLINGSFDKSYNAQKREIKLACGSTVGLKTYDQDLDAWASAEIHRIRWDEEPNNANGRRMRQEARARLVSTGGDEVLGMTPMLGISTWAYDEVYERRNEPGVDVVTMTIHDNPWNSKEAIEKFLAGLTDEERRARESGEFVHFGGLFFDEFRPSLHEVECPKIEDLQKQEIVVCIDPGLRYTGVTWSAWDSDNSGLFFAEYFPPKINVPDIAFEIKRRNKEWGLGEPMYVIDPSYRNLTTDIHADAVQAAYEREDIYAAKGQNDRRAGILGMKARLQAKDGEGTPCPTLLYAKPSEEDPNLGVPQLVEQTQRYRRNPDAADEWTAVPQDDRTRFDLVDSSRYAVMSRNYDFAVDGEHEKPRRSETYVPDFEEPFDQDDFQIEAPPMGSLS